MRTTMYTHGTVREESTRPRAVGQTRDAGAAIVRPEAAWKVAPTTLTPQVLCQHLSLTQDFRLPFNVKTHTLTRGFQLLTRRAAVDACRISHGQASRAAGANLGRPSDEKLTPLKRLGGKMP
eukprot:6457598-Prymnesium_polylepis.1